MADLSEMKAREANNDVENPPTYTERDNVAGNGDTLPSYTQASSGQEAPPTYDSLFGRVKAAKQESTGIAGFLKTFLIILLSTVGFTILMGLFLAIPISMLVMGALNIDNCRAEEMIPIYLVVAGSFGVAKNLFSLVNRCRKNKEELEEDSTKVNPLVSLVDCFLFAWFIAGNVWIYRTTDRDGVNKDADNYCDDTLYYFAFWVTTSVYIIMGTTCCCMCTFGILAACCSGRKEGE